MKIRYEYRFLILIVFLTLLIGISGYQIYSRIAGFVENVQVKLQPDEKVLLLQKIKNDLISAENDTYNYTLSENEKILDDYKNIQDSVHSKMEKLKYLSKSSKSYSVSIADMDTLIHKKFAIMDTILVIQDNYRVNRAFNKMLDVINDQSSSGATKPTLEPKKEGVFKKLFSREKKEPVEEIDESTLNKEDLKRDISLIKKEEGIKEISTNEKLLELKREDTRTMQTINNLIGFMQHQSQLEMEKMNSKARKDAKETNYIVAIFVVVAILMLGFVFYVVYDYVKYSRKYNSLLIRSKQESEKLADEKSRFLATMSHEIRTPMNAILGFSDLLVRSELPEEHKNKAQMINSSAEFLMHLINDTLEVSKLDAGKIELQLEPTDLRKLLHEIQLLFENLVKEKGNHFELVISEDVSRVYLIDINRLKQILINLVNNANKFTKHGTVSIAALTENEKVVFEITDTGIGMTEDQLNKIFNEYEQADNTIEKEYGGSGLGLPITKRIVDLYGGTISIKSEPGKGSKFTVELPLQAIQIMNEGFIAEPDEEKIAEILQDKKILIADDEAFNRKLIALILNKQKCKMEFVENGWEALEKLTTQDFDLVLMDINMPKMDGITFITEYIESGLSNRNIPVLALTAYNEDVSFYIDYGFSDLLRKPFKEHELVDKLEELLRSKRKTTTTKLHELDLSAFKKMFEGNEQFYKEMLETFITSTQIGIDELTEAIDKQDVEKIKEITHRIAPPCKQINAVPLYQKLKKMENETNRPTTREEWKAMEHKLETISKSIFEQIRKELTLLNERK